MYSFHHLLRLSLIGLLTLLPAVPFANAKSNEARSTLHHLDSRSKLKSTVLSVTNGYRAKHGAPALSWNSTLATYASEWAKKCEIDPLTHSDGPYAESLADYPNMRSGIKAWYSEIEYINFDAPKYTSKTGHYINMMYATVTQIGCAKQLCDGSTGYGSSSNPKGATLEVCEYWPLYSNMLTPKRLKKNLKPVQ